MFDRYSFVAITTVDLPRAKRFWVEQLGCSITEERSGDHFIVNVGGLRLCVDLADGKTHIPGSTDPTIGLKVGAVQDALQVLAGRGITERADVVSGARGNYAIIHDPDGRSVVLTEAD